MDPCTSDRFIMEWEIKDNGIRTLLLMQTLRGEKSPVLLLSTNAKKAFGRVDWGLMMNTIEAMELGLKMVHWF